MTAQESVDIYVATTKAWANEKKVGRANTLMDFLKRNEPSSQPALGNLMPEYWTGYNYALQQEEAISPHTTRGLFPRLLFDLRTPNQTDEERNYIRSTFKSVTIPVWADFIATITRACNRQNYKVKIEAKDAVVEGMTNYINQEIPELKDFFSWFENYLPPTLQRSANGVIAVRPYFIPTIEMPTGEVVISNELIKPIPVHFKSESILGIGQDWILLEDPNEFSIIEEGGKSLKVGKVLYYFDSVNIQRCQQIGKRSDLKFSEPQIFFEHLCNEMPVIKLGGTPNFVGTKVVYDSSFSMVADILDLVLLDQNNINIAKTKCIYPFRIMLGSICDFQIDGISCDKGYINSSDGNKSVCPSCKGLGSVSRVSPLGELLINPEDQFGNGDKIQGMSSPIQFISPPIDTVEFLVKEVEKNEARARKIIHLADSDTQVTGNESATATGSLNKLRSTFAFIKPISDRMFTIARNVGGWMLLQRYGEGKFIISDPTGYDSNTPADYLAAIGEAKTMGVPPMVIHQLTINYLNSISSSDQVTKDAFQLLIDSDELLSNTQDEISMRINTGTAQKWQDVLHNSGMVLIDELLTNNPQFFLQEYDLQKTQLIELAKSRIPETVDPIRQILGV